MTVIPNLFAEVALEWTIAGSARPSATVFGVANAGADTPGQIALDVEAACTAGLLDGICAETVLNSIRVETGEGGLTDYAVVHAGQLALSQAPPNVTYLIRKSTGLTGRKRQGRMYIPGVPEGDITAGGFLTAGGRDVIQDAADAFYNSLDGNGHPIVVLHNDAGVTPPTDVANLLAEAKVATQRRRLRSS